MNYEKFLKQKRKYKVNEGISVELDELNDKLFNWQKFCVKWALKKGKCALFEACGLGKTMQQLEWASQVYKHTKGNVLIVAPLGVAVQTAKEEAPKLNIEVHIIREDYKIKDGINIINYEMLDKIDTKSFVGVVLDESSILKNFTGKIKNKITQAFNETPYKLCCTATPAPNDYMELLNHADFLDIMSTAQALSIYFINDMKTGNWRLKGHATVEFWKWVCSWALNIEKPSDIGFDDKGYVLPKLNEYEEIVEVEIIADDFQEGFFRDVQMSATSLYKERKNTIKVRAQRIMEIIEKNANEQYLIWVDMNEEADEFHVRRRVVFVNLRTNDYLLEITGNCSVKGGEGSTNNELEVICRTGEDKYQKHFLHIADETTYTVEQLEYNDVSRYDYEIVFRPEAIIPIQIKTQTGEN